MYKHILAFITAAAGSFATYTYVTNDRKTYNIDYFKSKNNDNFTHVITRKIKNDRFYKNIRWTQQENPLSNEQFCHLVNYETHHPFVGYFYRMFHKSAPVYDEYETCRRLILPGQI